LGNMKYFRVKCEFKSPWPGFLALSPI